MMGWGQQPTKAQWLRDRAKPNRRVEQAEAEVRRLQVALVGEAAVDDRTRCGMCISPYVECVVHRG